MILIADELNEREKKVNTLRGRIFAKLIYTMAYVYVKREEKHFESFKEQLEKIEKNQNVIDSYLRDWVLMSIKVTLGSIYSSNGEYDSAVNYFLEASSLNDKYNWKLRQVDVLLLTGSSYGLQDEVELAIVKYQEAIELAKEIGYARGILVNEYNLVDCFCEKGDFHKSLELAKILYNKAQEVKIASLAGGSLSSIIHSLLELGLDNQVQTYLDELEELTRSFPRDNTVNYSYQYSRALILKSSKSFADRIKAQTLFTQLLNDIPGSLTDPKIVFHIAELTLKELQSTNNEELFVEFEKKVDLLKEKALQFRSPSMQVEIYLLESKLALLKMNLKKAQQKLDQALKLAREKNLHRMVFKVSKAYDKFLDEKMIWESMIKHVPKPLNHLQRV